MVVVTALISIVAGAAAAENFKKLSGDQIRARFAGMQLTDQVHWCDVYERDGSLRSYSMGRTRSGKWFIQKDELCVDLPEPDAGCFKLGLSGKRAALEMASLPVLTQLALRASSSILGKLLLFFLKVWIRSVAVF